MAGYVEWIPTKLEEYIEKISSIPLLPAHLLLLIVHLLKGRPQKYIT
jgi:hypothetical protein